MEEMEGEVTLNAVIVCVRPALLVITCDNTCPYCRDVFAPEDKINWKYLTH